MITLKTILAELNKNNQWFFDSGYQEEVVAYVEKTIRQIASEIPCEEEKSHTMASENADTYKIWDNGHNAHCKIVKKYSNDLLT